MTRKHVILITDASSGADIVNGVADRAEMFRRIGLEDLLKPAAKA